MQMDLFTRFLTNDQSQVSNTVEIWESIPKYFFTARQVEKLRAADGSAKPYRWSFTYNGQPCMVRVQPAYIDEEGGASRAYFPSVTEELVEEALKKILTMQNMGMHDVEKSETWVRFTLRMIQRELKARNKSRSIAQIKHAIDVMSSCVLTVLVNDKEVWRGAILQDLVTVDRSDYLADIEAHHVARLPLFITNAINKLEYRQFNYDRLMGCKEQLSRWIYKRLINRYKQASVRDGYHFMYSDLLHSGLLQQASDDKNRSKVRSALNELEKCHVVLSWREEVVKDGKKIVDAKYVVTAHPDFTREQKASNKRQSDDRLTARKQGVLSAVDKPS